MPTDATIAAAQQHIPKESLRRADMHSYKQYIDWLNEDQIHYCGGKSRYRHSAYNIVSPT